MFDKTIFYFLELKKKHVWQLKNYFFYFLFLKTENMVFFDNIF